MTHQGPGKELRACPGKEAAGEVLRRCEGQLVGTGGVEGETDLCGHKHHQRQHEVHFGFHWMLCNDERI